MQVADTGVPQILNQELEWGIQVILLALLGHRDSEHLRVATSLMCKRQGCYRGPADRCAEEAQASVGRGGIRHKSDNACISGNAEARGETRAHPHKYTITGGRWPVRAPLLTPLPPRMWRSHLLGRPLRALPACVPIL